MNYLNYSEFKHLNLGEISDYNSRFFSCNHQNIEHALVEHVKRTGFIEGEITVHIDRPDGDIPVAPDWTVRHLQVYLLNRLRELGYPIIKVQGEVREGKPCQSFSQYFTFTFSKDEVCPQVSNPLRPRVVAQRLRNEQY